MKRLNKSMIFKIAIMLLFLLFPLVVEKFVYPNSPISMDRYIILAFISEFICINILFDRKKIWDFCYRKRYFILLFIFSYLVVNGYHTSSMGMYDSIIQPNHSIEEGLPFIGTSRFIRTDEYAVDTMSILSNARYNELKIHNNYLMSSNLNVEVFPNLPTKSLGSLTDIRYLGFLFLPTEMAYSFYCYVNIFICFIALFEFFMIVTKSNKLVSLLGSVLICFSPVLAWWNAYIFLACGMICFHLFRLFLRTDKPKLKLLYSILLGWAGASYIMILYPAWQLTYGYIFLGLFIWQLIENKKNLAWKDLLYLIPCILVIAILVIPQIVNSLDQIFAMLNTVYPGARNVLGGESWERNFLYIPSIFYSFINIDNPCEFSQTLSLYPLPIIFGIIQFIKNCKNGKSDCLLNITLILSLFFTIFNYIEVPLLSKITFMYMVPGSRVVVVSGVLCVFLIVILLSKYTKKEELTINQLIVSSFVALATSLVATYISYIYLTNNSTINYLTTDRAIISIFVFSILGFLFVLNHKKYNRYFISLYAGVTIVSSILIFPMSDGFSVLYDKPVSKELEHISSKDKSATWLVTNSQFQVPNYLVANGVKTLNSVNYFPNFDVWNVIDEDGEFDYFYNRYTHILSSVTTDDTNFELVMSDLVKLNINEKDVCRLGIDYIFSQEQLNDGLYEELSLDEIYNEDGVYIYDTSCGGSENEK